ncbi:alpha/beta fold hydrolase [Streptomyces sp. NPDC020965]|uniref:alpha/beta fold hydrolase n=1 Tax=Streptomyces sp. NPDC020965 TaxID=3365105 RepID=UPI003798FFA1
MPVIELTHGPVEYRRTAGDPDLAPLVFLHEGLGCVAMWARFPDALARATGRSALIYSRHGYGGSGPARVPRPVTYMEEEASRVLPELLDRLALDRPVLVGHSDGASIALLHASERPVAGLVLLAPHVFVEPETLAGVAAAGTSYRDGPLARRLAGFHDDPDATFHSWADVWLSPAFREWNIEDRLPAIDDPVLVIQGEHDQYGTVRQLRAIEEGVGGPVRRVEIAECGHSPHLERPAETREAVVRFLAPAGTDPGPGHPSLVAPATPGPVLS